MHAWPSIRDVPKTPDLAVICIPAATVPQGVRECGAAGVRGIVILSAGFREIGEQGRELERQTSEEARKFPGLRIIGPNCLGVIAPGLRLNATFARQLPRPGHVAFISHSGALCTAILDWAEQKKLGFSYFVSIGNMLDVDLGDLIDYFGQQPEVRSIILYAESVTNARKFMSAARAFARIKPIVAYKSGRFAESAKAAASHTGAMAGEDAVFDTAFQRAGIERCYEVDDMFDCAELLAWQRPPAGPRLAIVTNAGGPGVMAADALLARDGVLASLSGTSLDKLNAVLPPYWSHGNPVDVLGDAGADRYQAATEVVLKDENVDGVLVILTPQAMTDATASAEAVGKLAAGSSRPIIAAWMGGPTVEPGVERLNKCGIPTYQNPGQAVRAFMHLVSYSRNRDMLYEMPREVPIRFALDQKGLQKQLAAALGEPGSLISEAGCKSLLAAYGIPTTKTLVARSADEAVRAAREIGLPVVMKVLSPDISHKTDVGGVELDLRSDEAVRAAYGRITASALAKVPQAKIEGVTVQEMIAEPAGQELILGAKKDATFGAVLLVGMGGIAAEVMKDRVLELASAERAAGAADARETPIVAPAARISGPPRSRRGTIDRGADPVFVSHRRFSRDQGIRHQSAFGFSAARGGARRPRGPRRAVSDPDPASVRASCDPSVSGRFCASGLSQERASDPAAADSPGGRALVARPDLELFVRDGPRPVSLFVQADDA